MTPLERAARDMAERLLLGKVIDRQLIDGMACDIKQPIKAERVFVDKWGNLLVDGQRRSHVSRGATLLKMRLIEIEGGPQVGEGILEEARKCGMGADVDQFMNIWAAHENFLRAEFPVTLQKYVVAARSETADAGGS